MAITLEIMPNKNKSFFSSFNFVHCDDSKTLRFVENNKELERPRETERER